MSVDPSSIAVSGPAEMVELLKPFAGGELAAPHQTEWLLPGGGIFRERPHPSKFVRKYSEPGERPGELYSRMLDADTDMAGLFEKRVKAVLALPRYIQARDGSPLARDVSTFVHQALGQVRSRVINIGNALSAIPCGLSVDELIWEQIPRGPLAGAWLPVDIIDRPISRFAFRADDGLLHIRRRGGFPQPAPPGKFLVHSYATKDNPWGAALLDDLYWYWFVKKHAVKFWSVFVERFAQPLPVGHYKHRSGADKDTVAYNQEQQNTLLRAIEVIRTGTGIVLPEGLALTFLEATRSGDASYQGLTGWISRAMALVVLGEVDTSGLAKGPGSFAKSTISNEVRVETVKHDASVLGSWETDTLVRWIVMANYGPDAPVPKSVYDAMDAMDREQRRKGIESALRVGEPVSRAYYRMTNQLPPVQDGDEVITAQQPASAPTLAAAAPLFAVQTSAPSGRIIRLAADDPLVQRAEERDADYLAVVEAMMPHTLAYYEAHLARVLDLWDVGAQADLRRLVDPVAAVRHAEVLQTSLVHGMGFGLLHLREDLDAAGAQLSAAGEWSQWTTPQTAIEHWARLLGISKDVFLTLSDDARRVAFAVAGLQEGSLLADVHQLLGRAQAEGMGRAEFVAALHELYDRAGVTRTSKHHAELVYANNVRQAAGVIQWLQTVGNPQVHSLIPYLVYLTLGDERVRQREGHNHVVMHGHIAAISHEIWRTWWYPAGHACRCLIAVISRAEARRRGLVGAEPSGPWPLVDGRRAMPDPGFAGVPSFERPAAAVELKVDQMVEEAEAAKASPLLEALLLLLRLLGLLFSADFHMRPADNV